MDINLFTFSGKVTDIKPCGKNKQGLLMYVKQTLKEMPLEFPVFISPSELEGFKQLKIVTGDEVLVTNGQIFFNQNGELRVKVYDLASSHNSPIMVKKYDTGVVDASDKFI